MGWLWACVAAIGIIALGSIFVGPAASRGSSDVLDLLCDPADFPCLPPPGPGDWRAVFHERRQDFDAYVRSRPIRAAAIRRKIAIQPVGAIDEDARWLLERARAYAEAFFACPVVLKRPIPLPARDRRERTGWGRRWWQYRTDLFLGELLPPALAKDEICLIGVTMADLYPEPSWNFVFGQASLRDRVGIYSLARYLPSFYGEAAPPESGSGQEGELRSPRVLRRVLKVLAHETCHMFGLHHCQDHPCLVNGSNSLGEADRRPLHLCGPCLRKLAWNRGFDPVARYRKLEAFFRARKIEEEARWIRGRLAKVEAAGGARKPNAQKPPKRREEGTR